MHPDIGPKIAPFRVVEASIADRRFGLPEHFQRFTAIDMKFNEVSLP